MQPNQDPSFMPRPTGPTPSQAPNPPQSGLTPDSLASPHPAPTQTPVSPAPQPSNAAPTPQIFGPQSSTSPQGQQGVGNATPAQNPGLHGATPTGTFSPRSTTVVGGSDTPPTGQVLAAKPPKRKFGIKKVMLVALVLLVAAGGGGAYAYYTVMNNKPEKVLADALSNTMTDVLDRKPMTSVGNLQYVQKSENGMKVTLDFSAKQADENYQSEATLQVEAAGRTIINVKGAAIGFSKDEEAYVKFDNLKETVEQLKDVLGGQMDTSPYNALIEKIDGKWIKIDAAALSELGFDAAEEKVSKCTEAFTNLRIAKPDQKNIKEIFLRNQFAIASEKLDSESVDGEKSFHYKLDFNEDASVQFAKELVELESFKTVKADCGIDTSQFDKAKSSADSVTSAVKDEVKPVFELWVGTQSRRPTRAKVTVDDKSFTAEFVSNVKIDAKDVSIDKPTESIYIVDLMKEFESVLGASTDIPSSLLPSFTNGASQHDVERETAVKRLQASLESYYADNGYYPTLTQMNDDTFRRQHFTALNESAYKDPAGDTTLLLPSPIRNAFAYQATPAGCQDGGCTGYALTATLDNERNGSKVYVGKSQN